MILLRNTAQKRHFSDFYVKKLSKLLYMKNLIYFYLSYHLKSYFIYFDTVAEIADERHFFVN